MAHFPWDPPLPKTEPSESSPAAQTPVPPTASASTGPSTELSQPQQQQTYLQTSLAPVEAATRIKTEPPDDATAVAATGLLNATAAVNSNTTMNAHSARERAANMLHQKYGAAAADSVSQLQAQSQAALAMPGQLPRPQQTQYQQVNGAGNASKSQMDGSSDPLVEWKEEAQRRRQATKDGHAQNDRVLLEQLQQRMRQMQGGGLLLPLDAKPKQKPRPGKGKGRLNRQDDEIPRPRGQFDGPYDSDNKAEEDDDEDAINSDLDDSEEDLLNDENEGNESVGQVMLCTYDKVQRVKSKWKCTLKDGILTTGGKEYVGNPFFIGCDGWLIVFSGRYVFHKGQGELEW